MKVISTIEYRPHSTDSEKRRTQGDMYTTNMISLHGRPCIGVDISGGNNVVMWNIMAMGYFGNPKKEQEEKPIFECSQLHNGKGLDALLGIALGFVKAATDGVDNPNNEEYRLGPVVA